jgi:hypothetical protein
LSLFADDTTLYIENYKGFTRKLLELINEFSKVAGYKNQHTKIAALLTHTANHLKYKSRKQSCLQLLQKISRNKFIQRNIMKTYKVLMKHMKRTHTRTHTHTHTHTHTKWKNTVSVD